VSKKQRPEPPQLETNDVLIAMVGTVAWAVALLVLLIVGLPEPDRWWLWVCVAGIGIGLFGVWYIPRLQRSRAALEARRRPNPDEGNGGASS
jgi:H+/Cl- antiporter ClcA